MDKLQEWEKPWINDFRGTNRSRPTPAERGLAPQPKAPNVVRPRQPSPRHKHSAGRGVTPRLVGAPTPNNQPPPDGGFRIIGEPANQFGQIRTPSGTGGPPYRPMGRYAQSDALGYEYRQDRILGPAPTPNFGAAYAVNAMGALQRDPNMFFPFRVVGHHGEQDIELGATYDLTNRETSPAFPLPPGRFPVWVTRVTPTSFTFSTLEGHFDPEGSTITFTIWADETGTLHLEHLAIAASKAPNPMYLLAPTMAGLAWDAQAQNLRQWLQHSR